jgi:NTE family protein
VIEPAEIDGRLLCDGNFSNSLPVSVVRAMGADYVIGVDIFTPAIRPRFGAFGYLAAGLEVLIQSSGGGIHDADCLISPNLAGETYLRFSQRKKLIELGAQAARERLGDIQRVVESVPAL